MTSVYLEMQPTPHGGTSSSGPPPSSAYWNYQARSGGQEGRGRRDLPASPPGRFHEEPSLNIRRDEHEQARTSGQNDGGRNDLPAPPPGRVHEEPFLNIVKEELEQAPLSGQQRGGSRELSALQPDKIYAEVGPNVGRYEHAGRKNQIWRIARSKWHSIILLVLVLLSIAMASYAVWQSLQGNGRNEGTEPGLGPMVDKIENLTSSVDQLIKSQNDLTESQKDFNRQLTEMRNEMLKLDPFRTQIDEEGSTVFQRRQDGSVGFNINWNAYVNGFGNPYGSFWMGLARLHEITSSGNYELRIDLKDWENGTAYAHYSDFSIGDASTNFTLSIGSYSGTAGDSLSYYNGLAFSTFDSDHDTWSEGTALNCAETRKGGWWWKSCGFARLNGLYYVGGKYSSSWADGITWYHWKNDSWYSMKFVEMKFRRNN